MRGRALVAVAALLLASACSGQDSEAASDRSTDASAPTAEPVRGDATSSAVADPEHSVADPGPLQRPLLTADMLIFSQESLSPSMIAAIRRIKGVTAVASLSLAQVSIENKVINVAAVDPATYRRFTPIGSAQLQEVWTRVAGGELAINPRLGKQVQDTKGYLRLGNDVDAPQVHIGAYAPQIPQVDAVVNASWGEALNMKPGNALVVSTGMTSPSSVRKPIQKIAGTKASVQSLDAVARYGLDISVQQTAFLVGSVADAVGTFNYTVLGGGRIAPDPSWVASHIATEPVPILGSVTCNTLIFPQLRAALEEIIQRGLGEQDPPRRVRRLLLPAVHRRHDLALEPLVRAGAEPQRARQPARHGRGDGSRRGVDLQEVGLRLGRRLELHRPHALRDERPGQPALTGR